MVARGQAASPSQELIFLDPDDDLGTVRAKLESSPADQVFLVLPSRASTLRTPLEFRILARIAHELSTDVTIVSADAGRRQMARREGLRSRRRYGGIRNMGATPAVPGWLPAIPDWVPLPSITATIVLTAIVAVIGAVALVALPVMRVTVTPLSENIQRELELVVDPNVKVADPGKALLPGELMQYRFETAGSVSTTGQKNVGRDPARGEVVFTNASQNLVVLPPRSVIVARNGARFLTDAEVRINPFSFGIARTTVTAEQRGIAANVDANQMASMDPPVDKLTVANPKPMTGGSDRQSKSVTAVDLAKLKEQLLQRAKEQAMAEFSARAGQAKSTPGDTLQLRVESENYQPPVEAEGDQLTGTMGIAASVVAWDNQSLNSLVQKMLLSKYGPQYDLPMGQLRLAPPEVQEAQNQRMRVNIRADAVVVYTVEPGEIAGRLRGKSTAEAETILQTVPGLAGPPRIDLSPTWAPWAYRVEVGVSAPK